MIGTNAEKGMPEFRAVIVVGNPRLASRTRDVAERVADSFGCVDAHVIELAELSQALFDRNDPDVRGAIETVQNADLAIFASPTYKATYTGLLKLFLDLFPGDTGLKDVVALAIMVGGSDEHALAPELTLKPVLAELGASTPARALFVNESSYADGALIKAYGERWRPTITRLLNLEGSAE